ncbi:hypothetical protein K466DRAFT_631853 [Polyporus arcularius HHB13444]|uniref:Uncharacterized protein n=1 Tax=Polyporus arcularius HHB13444 TaxID=1314778 RepID=A0A5C3NYQ8_9APHY|nr:hypothetical protein K466DRAFT_631853 [Polyporus arcularius HHB13444]
MAEATSIGVVRGNGSHAMGTRRAERAEGRNGARSMEQRGLGSDEAVVYAWWKTYGEEHEKTGGTKAQRHVYTTTLRPTTQLGLGTRVRLVALAKGTTTTLGASLRQYNPYDPHVVGTAVNITQQRPGWVTITLRNECRGNNVGMVDLEMPYVPGETVRCCCLEGADECQESTEETPRDDDERWWMATRCGAEKCGTLFKQFPQQGLSHPADSRDLEELGALSIYVQAPCFDWKNTTHRSQRPVLATGTT